eukprot:757477-Rhodomonas_salina.5
MIATALLRRIAHSSPASRATAWKSAAPSWPLRTWQPRDLSEYCTSRVASTVYALRRYRASHITGDLGFTSKVRDPLCSSSGPLRIRSSFPLSWRHHTRREYRSPHSNCGASTPETSTKSTAFQMQCVRGLWLFVVDFKLHGSSPGRPRTRLSGTGSQRPGSEVQYISTGHRMTRA